MLLGGVTGIPKDSISIQKHKLDISPVAISWTIYYFVIKQIVEMKLEESIGNWNETHLMAICKEPFGSFVKADRLNECMNLYSQS